MKNLKKIIVTGLLALSVATTAFATSAYNNPAEIVAGLTGRSVESVIDERQGEKPDLTLYEEFFTKNAKITSDLHDTPIVYDLKTGEKIKELEKDAYLTYVTEVGDYIITEYISSEGKRYGLLLDKDFNTIAKLPNLFDIIDNKFIFDYMDDTFCLCWFLYGFWKNNSKDIFKK